MVSIRLKKKTMLKNNNLMGRKTFQILNRRRITNSFKLKNKKNLIFK